MLLGNTLSDSVLLPNTHTCADEPTTGMDPRVRRDIWNLILRMKHNRVTIMTTHSMEEADILGDNIVIMANGQLRLVQGAEERGNKMEEGMSNESLTCISHCAHTGQWALL